jgi:hypothetical protein
MPNVRVRSTVQQNGSVYMCIPSDFLDRLDLIGDDPLSDGGFRLEDEKFVIRIDEAEREIAIQFPEPPAQDPDAEQATEFTRGERAVLGHSE